MANRQYGTEGVLESQKQNFRKHHFRFTWFGLLLFIFHPVQSEKGAVGLHFRARAEQTDTIDLQSVGD